VSGLPLALVDKLASRFTVVWLVVMMEYFAGPAIAVVICMGCELQPVVGNWPAVDRLSGVKRITMINQRAPDSLRYDQVWMETHSGCGNTRVRARYAETDQMGVIHHANYYVWMEVARVELCATMGFRYRDMEKNDGVMLAVIESSCRYINAVHFDEEVIIATEISFASSRMVTFSYDMSVEGRRVATASTRHIFLNRLMRPTHIPNQYRPLFGLPPK
jgi:acyl-CoA thioester hydrolase